jgi:hypothetical protein
MKAILHFGLPLLLAATLVTQPQLRAGDKKSKEPEKKQQEPAKPVVVNDELISADLKDKVNAQSYCKTYTFRMEKGKAYQIELASMAFQSYLRLEDAAGSQVAFAFDQFGNRRAILFYESPKTQDYQIVVTSPNDGRTGKFTLIVKDATGYSILNVADKLNANDKAYANAGNKKHKSFVVNLEEGKTYQIDMKSKSFDSYLYFESPEGKVLAQDDDGGGYPDARIIHKAAKTGKYRVITTHFGGGGNLGDFTLTVRQTEGEPPLVNKIILDKKEEKK